MKKLINSPGGVVLDALRREKLVRLFPAIGDGDRGTNLGYAQGRGEASRRP